MQAAALDTRHIVDPLPVYKCSGHGRQQAVYCRELPVKDVRSSYACSGALIYVN